MGHQDPTPLETKVMHGFVHGTALDLRPEGWTAPLPPAQGWDSERQVRSEVLVQLLTGMHRPDRAGVPALRLAGCRILGTLCLEAAEVPYLVEFTCCEFDQRPDLRMAGIAGLRLVGCRLPGLQAANLRVRADLVLDGSCADGVIELTDAEVGGSLRLESARLSCPDQVAVDAERLRVDGALVATELSVHGEVRLYGAQIGGNLDFGGSQLVNPSGDALMALGVQVTGALLCDWGRQRRSRFTTDGRMVLTGATVHGPASFSGAQLRARRRDEHPVLVLPRGTPDVTTVLAAERMQVGGNLALDDEFDAAGTVWLPHARVGGYLRLSGATLGSAELLEHAGNGLPIALYADGIEVVGDLEARGPVGRRGEPGTLQVFGQIRLVDAHVHGSASLSGARLHGPALDVLLADRLTVGGTLYLARLQAEGSVRLQNAHIESSLDCTGAQLTHPRRRPDGSVKPSLDARVISIGKDVFCSYGFTATGGVRLRRADVSKSVNFTEARLGGEGPVALNLYGLTTQELVLRFAVPPIGDVWLTRAEVASVYDSGQLWRTDGTLDLEDFRYAAITADVEVDVRTRLRWLKGAVREYDPDPYDQLAASYRDAGHDDRADAVQLAKQRRRHASQGPVGRLWGWLQEWTVGYGYRPWLAALWLAMFWLAGVLWFGGHRLNKLDSDQDPAWNPWLYAADLLIPVVNLGQDGLWRTEGTSAFVASLLTMVGWTLATTAAAGAARILNRS